MKVSYLAIKALNPCANRFDNFTSNYPNFEDSHEKFLSLENITYDDKTWVMTRLLSRQVLVRWALACADSVSHVFNEKYPNKPEINNLLHYMKTLDLDNISDDQKQELMKLRFDANAVYAATAASAAAAYADAAAYAANYADIAAYTAAAIAAAAYADADAAASVAAYAVVYAADAAAAYADAAAYAANYADIAAYTAAAIAAGAYTTKETREELNLLLLNDIIEELGIK